MAQRLDLTNIKVEVSDPQFLSFMQQIFENVRDYYNVREAKAIAEKLGTLLEQNSELAATNPNLYRQYEELTLLYKFIALPILPPEEVEKLITQNLVAGLNIQDFDLRQALDAFLLTFSSDLDMFQFLDRLEKLLEKSEIQIGNAPLDTPSGSKKSILANWIAEYLRSNVGRSERGSLEEISFVTKNKSVQQLSKEDRDVLKKVLEFYDWLKFPKDVVGADFVSPELERAFKYVADNADRIVDEIVAAEQQDPNIKDAGAPGSVPLAPRPVRTESVPLARVLPAPPPPPRAPNIRQPTSPWPVQPRPAPRIAEEPKPRVQIPDISTELSVAEPRVQQPQSTPSLTKPTFTASPFRQSPPAAQAPAKAAPVVRPEPKPQQRPDLIKPVSPSPSPLPRWERNREGGSSTSYKLPATPPSAPHPTAADRSQISVAPKFAGAPKDMVKPQITQEPKNVRTEQQTPSQIPTTSPTLEALRRIRAEEEKQKQRIQSGQGAEPQIVPLGGMSDFSVNDALIHAGKGGRFGSGVSQGGAVAEGEPSGVADRLRKLEGKTTQEPKNARTEEPGAGKAPPTFPPPPPPPAPRPRRGGG